MNATQPLKILMPPGRRRDDSEKPQSAGDLFALSEKEKGTNSALAFDNRHAFRDDKPTFVTWRRLMDGVCSRPEAALEPARRQNGEVAEIDRTVRI